MLIISRKVNESFVINDQIEIQVIKVTGGNVKLGITAGKDIKIVRSELK